MKFNEIVELFNGISDEHWETRLEFEGKLGFKPFSIGFGKNLISFRTSEGPFERVLRLSKPRKNVKVESYLTHPINGLPLEKKVIPVGKKRLVGTFSEDTIERGIKEANRQLEENRARLLKEHGKKASEANEAKSQWMMTI